MDHQIECSFCSEKKEIGTLVGKPGVRICSECTHNFKKRLDEPVHCELSYDGCSFCSFLNTDSEVGLRVIRAGDFSVCEECLDLCLEIYLGVDVEPVHDHSVLQLDGLEAEPGATLTFSMLAKWCSLEWWQFQKQFALFCAKSNIPVRDWNPDEPVLDQAIDLKQVTQFMFFIRISGKKSKL